MDIGAAGIVSWIASSTNQSLVTYSPIFLLIGGIVLAFIVMTFLVGILTRNVEGGIDGIDLDDTMEI
jgi:hypothetical protein